MAILSVRQKDGTWVDIPAIVGPRGYSGVYVGTDNPPENANVWINPNGEPTGTEDWEFDLDDGSTDTKQVVVLNSDESSGKLAVLRFKQADGTWMDIPAIKGDPGEPGEPGEPGYTPVKGVDYNDGESGVYVGTGTPPANANVWVNPTGDPTSTEDWEFDMDDGSTDTKQVVVLNSDEATANGVLGILKVKQTDGTWKEIPALVGGKGDKGDKGDPGSIECTFSANRPGSSDGADGEFWFTYTGRDENTLLLLPSDDFTDRSPYGVTLTNHGAVISDTVSKFGIGSLYFDGSSYLSFESTHFDFGTGDFTIDFWVMPETQTGDRFIFSGSEKGDLFLGLSSSSLGLGRVGVAWDHKAIISLSYESWNHVAVVKANGTLYFFLNGAQFYSLANSASYAFPSMKINVGAQGGSNCFKGYIDEFRVSNVARWTAAFVPPTTSYTENNRDNAGYFKKDGKWHEMVSLPDVDGKITTHDADAAAHADIRQAAANAYSIANNTRALAGDAYNLGNNAKTRLDAMTTENWTFTLEDGSKVTKAVYVG